MCTVNILIYMLYCICRKENGRKQSSYSSEHFGQDSSRRPRQYPLVPAGQDSTRWPRQCPLAKIVHVGQDSTRWQRQYTLAKTVPVGQDSTRNAGPAFRTHLSIETSLAIHRSDNVFLKLQGNEETVFLKGLFRVTFDEALYHVHFA